MLEADPHAQLLDHATKLAAVSAALAEGTGTAEALRARFPDLAPHGIARELGVPIETIDDDPAVGSLWRFAEYRGRPARIVLYRRGLAPLDRAVGDGLAVRLLGQATPQEVFVAHELFHHIEATRSDIPMARRYRPTLFRIGRWHWRTGIATLSEIAAGGFARAAIERARSATTRPSAPSAMPASVSGRPGLSRAAGDWAKIFAGAVTAPPLRGRESF